MLINCGFINSKKLKDDTNTHTKYCHTHKIDIIIKERKQNLS